MLGNLYSWAFGWPQLSTIHRGLLSLSLHALGYDNSYGTALTGELRFVRKVLTKHDIQVCIDVGANHGEFAEMLARELQAKVYAVEPGAKAYAALSERAKHIPLITPKHVALTNRTGNATLYAKVEGAGTASLHEHLVSNVSISEEVTLMTGDIFLNQLNLQRIDFIKIDTEGHEREVLEGLQKSIKEFRPSFVQFEFNILHLKRGYSVYDLSQLLPGYRFYRLVPHGLVSVDPERFSSNIYMFSNFVAVRKDVKI